MTALAQFDRLELANGTGIHGERSLPLERGWELCLTPPGKFSSPAELSQDLLWHSASVPGTAAQALQAHGLWNIDHPEPLHDRDVWYRVRFHASPQEVLRFEGLAGVAQVWIDGEPLLRCENMFIAHEAGVPSDGESRLHICFHALAGLRRPQRRRARWRVRLVPLAALRDYRLTLLGHMPGWCPEVHAVGPYRPVMRVQRRPGISVLSLSAVLHGSDGVLDAEIMLAHEPDSRQPLRLRVGDSSCAFLHVAPGRWVGRLVLPSVERWWPHTHGAATLHEVFAEIGGERISFGRVGFRQIEVDRGADDRGFKLILNGVAVFCRGACWTSSDLVGLTSTLESYGRWIRLARDAGINMIRVGGTMLYEAAAFHALCDELGMMVWQDFMFANFDYPDDDAVFRTSVEEEVKQVLDRLRTSPSLVLLCGGSEVAQQAAMLGLAREERRIPLFEEVLPALAKRLRPDVPYIPNTPWGGSQPFAPDTGVCHYYGVGAYHRPLEDARRANVRFASECVAFANIPEQESLDTTPAAWTRVPRDLGASWDFADVRDHYLGALYKVDPAKLRGEDPDRYLELSRAVVADVIEAVFSEWRRPASACGGGLVWQLQDVHLGAGWGIIDSTGRPKSAWHGIRRVAAPIQVLLTDEGTNGIAVHLLNETADAVAAVLRLSCLLRGEIPVAEAERSVVLEARQAVTWSAYDLFDRFFDVSYAYRFGPSAHDVTIAAMTCGQTGRMLSQAFHFPLGRARPRDDLGMTALLDQDDDGWMLSLRTDRLAQAVQVQANGYQASENWFHLAPRQERRLRLVPNPGTVHAPVGQVRALNGFGAVRFRLLP